MDLIIPKKKISLVAVTGLPSSGKTERIANRLVDSAGYNLVSWDAVCLGKFGEERAPWDFTNDEWSAAYRELHGRKCVYLATDRDVVFDTCPCYDEERMAAIEISPVLREYLDSEGKIIERYFVALKVDLPELLERSRGKGRNDLRSEKILRDMHDKWVDPPPVLRDDYGEVPCFTYLHNTPEDNQMVIDDMGTWIGVNLSD